MNGLACFLAGVAMALRIALNIVQHAPTAGALTIFHSRTYRRNSTRITAS